MRTIAALLDRIPAPARGALATALAAAGITAADSIPVAVCLAVVYVVGGAWDVWRSIHDQDKNGVPDPIDRAVQRLGVDPAQAVELVTEAARIGLPHALAWLRRIGRAGMLLLALPVLGACGGASVVCPMGAEIVDVVATVTADDGSGASATVHVDATVCGLPLALDVEATSAPAVEACLTAPLVGQVCEGAP
jgi:hypothetical protein